jgi:hypothetical protein
MSPVMTEMKLDERWARWVQASVGAGAVDPFFTPTIQGLGRLDCGILSEDQRFRTLDQKASASGGRGLRLPLW